MARPRLRSSSGQAAAEYAAVVCLVGVGLAGATAALSGRALPEAIAAKLTHALCVVGGDLCSAEQARAAGLEPCVVAEERYTSRWNASGLFLKSSQQHGYRIQRRSDGRILVTAAHDRQAGAGVRVAARLGPAAASADASGSAGWQSGMVWELAGARALRGFLERAPKPHRLEHDADWRRAGLPAPGVRFVAGGAGAELRATVEAGLVVPLVSAHARAALGRRIGPQGTAWYFEVPAASAGLLGGPLPELGRASAGAWSAELDGGRDGRVERLVLRNAPARTRDGEEVELTRVVDLDDPRAAEAARDLLSPTRARAAAAELAGMGTLQRDVYRVRELDSGVDAELAAAVVGLGHADDKVRRRLVSSSIVDGEGRITRRFDCAGAAGAAR